MKKIKLSPSKLSLFFDCKRCFWIDKIKGIRRPTGIFPSLPNGMDMILKKHFDVYRSAGTLPPEIDGKMNGSLFNDMEKLNVWRNNRRGIQHVDESGAILMGALDDLFVTEDGFHVPVDFKTRGFPLKDDTSSYYQHQMDAYCFLLEKNGVKTADFAYLIFYYPVETNGNGKFSFKCDIVKLETNKKDAESHFKSAIETLQGPEPEPNQDCPWCNWNKI